MHTVFLKLFTPDLLRDSENGRTLVRLLNTHVPDWLPARYGWSEPLRHVYDPAKTDHFWSQLRLQLDWRNATRTATGYAKTRVGPYAILSHIKLSGEQQNGLALDGFGDFLADAARAFDLAYGVVHLFHPDEVDPDQDRGAFRRRPSGHYDLITAGGTLTRHLPDVFWGNVFGPPYVKLFGEERLRTAPAAHVVELRRGYFYVQLTEDITDVQENRPRLVAARDAVKAHLGADCFHEVAWQPLPPRRVPRFPMLVEEGLWQPPPGMQLDPRLRRLYEAGQARRVANEQ